MNNQPFGFPNRNQPPVQSFVKNTETTRNYTLYEAVFAWLALIGGYAFCRVFPVSLHPLAGLLLIYAVFMITTLILHLRGIKFSAMNTCSAGSALIVSLSLILSSNSFIHELAYLYAGVMFAYFIYSTTGNTLEKGFSELIFADFIKALLVMPFFSFTHVFTALGRGKGKRSGRVVLWVVMGVIIAIVPTVIIMLLLSYDRGFTDLIIKIFDIKWNTFFSHLLSVIFGLPIAMYFYGLYISSADHKNQKLMTAEGCRTASKNIKIMPQVTVLVAILPILAIYVIFFISQWQYYTSAFVGVLPGDIVYSQYAREGFFQLCTVSAINLLFIIAANIFTRRKSVIAPLTVKILSLVMSIFTLVLISTAMAKMMMYIKCYGLTPLRVYATWFILVLSVIFVIVIIRQFIKRFKIIAISFVACVVLFGALALSGIDSQIAKYNVEHFLAGELTSIDIGAMEELGDSAVPHMVRLSKALEKKIAYDAGDEETVYINKQVSDYLLRMAKKYDNDNGILALTIPRERAKSALESAGVKVE